jgi:hypothetical protein
MGQAFCPAATEYKAHLGWFLIPMLLACPAKSEKQGTEKQYFRRRWHLQKH